jgi:hypothetical protein
MHPICQPYPDHLDDEIRQWVLPLLRHLCCAQISHDPRCYAKRLLVLFAALLTDDVMTDKV